MSTPPPSQPPPPGQPSGAPRAREIVLRLDGGAGKGWRAKLGGGRGGEDRIRLVGTEIVFEHARVLRAPLTIRAGLVAVATVDRGRREERVGEDSGRFAILHRMSATAVLPVEEGVEGWLWTSRSGSALPMLGDGAPNLALVFVKPLEEDEVAAAFRPDFLAALAERSPLGAPSVLGLLARVADAVGAEQAFAELGVDRPLTDREVAPAQRRHLPTDKPANPSLAPSPDARRNRSVPPPGAR
jgi:hypothetical protein